MNLKKLAAAAAITLSLAGLGVVAGPAAAQAAPAQTSVGSVGGVTTLGRVCHYVTVKADPWYTCINLMPGTAMDGRCYVHSKLVCD
jgi:hypothetical protein